jgi:pimeloyl-ACP methyl ester carboxylesterase
MDIGDPCIISTARGPVEYVQEGSGPAVLCVHGAMGGYDQSITLGRTVGEAGFRYIAVSRPGYLGTPVKSGPTGRDQADLHAALLEALGIEAAVVMAISGGGPSAMHFAVRHAERCSKLVLCSTVGGPSTSPIPLSFHLVCQLARIRPFVQAMRSKVERDLEGSVARSITDAELRRNVMEDPETFDLYKVVLLDSFERMAERIPGTKIDIRVSREFHFPLEKIRVPTLVVHGTNDPMVSFDAHGKCLARSIPGAELCLCQGGEHASIFTHRHQVRAAVREFLAS